MTATMLDEFYERDLEMQKIRSQMNNFLDMRLRLVCPIANSVMKVFGDYRYPESLIWCLEFEPGGFFDVNATDDRARPLEIFSTDDLGGGSSGTIAVEWLADELSPDQVRTLLHRELHNYAQTEMARKIHTVFTILQHYKDSKAKTRHEDNVEYYDLAIQRHQDELDALNALQPLGEEEIADPELWFKRVVDAHEARLKAEWRAENARREAKNREKKARREARRQGKDKKKE